MDGYRLEIAVGTIALVALVIGNLAGLTPSDYAFEYVVPATMVAVGLLLGKRALGRIGKSGRVKTAAFGLTSTLLLALGCWLALEIYFRTPIEMHGHTL